MTGTDTTAASSDPAGTGETALPPIFSDDDGIDALWVQAYQGEVLGEVLFRRLAVILDDRSETDHAGSMRVLETLERRTKEAVAPALTRAGIPTAPDQEQLDLAAALAEGSADVAWEDLMTATVAITGQFIPLYQRIGELNPSERRRRRPARRPRGGAARLRPSRAGGPYFDVARSDPRPAAHGLSPNPSPSQVAFGPQSTEMGLGAGAGIST